MCGIAGFVASSGRFNSLADSLRAMTGAISHRGQDDSGSWCDPACGIALGHRRLSIIDLSQSGHQPMMSASGRYIIVYNGEIYNTADLRNELEAAGAAPPWRGHSDTEVLLASIDHWGLEGSLMRVNGMFAFGLWDNEERVLYLARDRLGEKPLYYGSLDAVFLFGSELQALQANCAFSGEIDRGALALFIRYGYIPAPRTIWRGISKLLPATYIAIRDGGRDVGKPICYWDFRKIATANAAHPLAFGPLLVEELEALLVDSVARRMTADVPLGAFLSGGIDSSTIVALMQSTSSRPVRTFSVGFHEPDYNEADYARAVASHLGTAHTQLYVSPSDALAIIPRLASIWDEPFSDVSQIPTYLICRLARQHVTVGLSGDGGDELFGGYNRHILGAGVGGVISRAPTGVRRVIASTLRSERFIATSTKLMRMFPSRHRVMALSERLPKLAYLLDSDDSSASRYRKLVSHCERPEDILVGDSATTIAIGEPESGLRDHRREMMYLDTLSYLPDDILTKMDRASMACGLEARIPYLDHRVVEFAWRIPISALIRNGTGKQILRKILYRYVPRVLVDRPKMGFSVPIGAWLCGPLRDWAEDLLDYSRLENDGFFNPLAVHKMWTEHKSQTHNWHRRLWDIVIFQSWLQKERAS